MSDTSAPDPPSETEAQMLRHGSPVEVAAHGMKCELTPETVAHMRMHGPAEARVHGPAETEAHGFAVSPADPSFDAYARLALTFPPDTPAQTFELRYRPAAGPGQAPEVELHVCRAGR